MVTIDLIRAILRRDIDIMSQTNITIELLMFLASMIVTLRTKDAAALL